MVTRSRARVIWKMLAWCLCLTALPALSQVHLSCVCQTVPLLPDEVFGTLPGFTYPTVGICTAKHLCSHLHSDCLIHTLTLAKRKCSSELCPQLLHNIPWHVLHWSAMHQFAIALLKHYSSYYLLNTAIHKQQYRVISSLDNYNPA